MAEHEMGTMDTSAQEKTYEGFVKACVRSTIAILLILVFLALVGA
ncbi:aa3-type cytochrome c oxidase subunit IV [Aliiroseovarius crassostreae]|uniref:Aa3-type cytochrome c oxidase subunit IV n=1 Tax=Aliiroseovarius crassostreae TaxID=154981 RepID=A0A9Q9HBU6_9RHOB|nr:aa3-type cytochrome c oxidase subunit IV [Aliiroseovarius crassostreae]UWP89284.1 aa3-type cytochrome c oxidase subunit IV [Aliiroseovarius crassostreae]UWP92418.1 aa3-type cytochrome c oxidase subunit IV [Aliiroseovarius crassostreae]UWP95562.1 aa3-type cytochrome c oxidase subunit IV [Aliiroseovarius crassostreae]UWP98730.1 aa3-type cytochrome c oxidase subunit IV [Aliiroseovarius crassostreae]UWQ01928.1 aa3-type cytochrome c oxidase subunit IV [Aliiroseovarius crassostreae]